MSMFPTKGTFAPASGSRTCPPSRSSNVDRPQSVVKRTQDLVRDGDDAFVFTLPWRGTVEIRAGAVEARVGPGEAIITSLNEVGSLRTPLGVRGVSLRVARKAALSL